ncbi:gamma-glutamyl-gamma-aminobutyrate hydrolase family protein [Dermacoccus nishinomiyaensis]|uniref:gamma-glutamyl-gamma-aminobutyrate hydrolase family protein n=1 Tax=Dermacoccus TaxID=57495 RepID=UPI00093F8815|nr:MULTISPECIES: gamma-glutamyl-gamma-aminobutyrate hydrolase family protein [Dermacoccus]MBO1757173.1 gamma-glutamyl-gamma-aminobutyrate hydrolase family protein [Dermacoccus sp. NHGro5]MCT1604523.1 gamma-glutamyl-gamma-aminobutyrate hydrolase family protein [Dermacoccus nishinomiyaensis]PZO99223.1 MAG: gamma-glutamyl-gamma-aminobutyrate hydrolase family protein [Dermacoccus nishinomiyaensis]QQY23546.1 gamma-glutamyl-gamma-aminobutyrate hydrolase family protein [Dermacoccus nishinomiyaensis]T
MSARKPVIGIITNVEYDPHYLFPGYRRVAVNEDYSRSITQAGGIPIMLPPSTDHSTLPQQLALLDGLLLAGGSDVDPLLYGQPAKQECQTTSPIRDAYEIEALRLARENRLPVLGICRGMQLINVALGGSLFQDLRYAGTDQQHMAMGNPASPLHHISVEERSFLHDAWGVTKAAVNSFHHQALDAVADALRVVARADDGLVEAVQHADDAWCLAAVQWHPEMMSGADVRSQQVFTWFVDAVTADAERRAAAGSARITANPTHGTAQAAS